MISESWFAIDSDDSPLRNREITTVMLSQGRSEPPQPYRSSRRDDSELSEPRHDLCVTATRAADGPTWFRRRRK